MAYIEDLTLQNSAGETKSAYSLIADLATAVGRINDKVLFATPNEELLEVDAEDGTNYFVDTTTYGAEITLPSAVGNAGFRVYAKNTAGSNGITFIRNGSDEINGVGSDLELNTVGDYAELISNGVDGWVLRYFYID